MLGGMGVERMEKLVWRVKLVAELGAGAVSEVEVARIKREDVAAL